ncbi:AbiTii domain-containing protein [Silvimonas amylolytica]|uniref:AbiTii domain-containing protein n=1 Tax=Silvimonas amylolytica TaxID=449663 RepID=A0ABQ2PQ92_9NEIS|nr:hypothetical protein [Silvimonas amylolytica]GGP27351.1 hypothetical protein GCM10010971_31700 [Silvimonas amylolytica]
MNECKAIRDALHNRTTSLVSLLKRTQRLAIVAGNARVQRWADHELNGYPDDEALPEYRMVSAQAWVRLQGNQVVIDAMLISGELIPAWLREDLTYSHLRNPISDYMPYLLGKHDDELRENWSRQLVAQLNAETRPFVPAMRCLEGWKTIHRSAVCEMVASCRDELLFALNEIEFGFGQSAAINTDINAIQPEPSLRPDLRLAISSPYKGQERRTA